MCKNVFTTSLQVFRLNPCFMLRVIAVKTALKLLGRGAAGELLERLPCLVDGGRLRDRIYGAAKWSSMTDSTGYRVCLAYSVEGFMEKDWRLKEWILDWDFNFWWEVQPWKQKIRRSLHLIHSPLSPPTSSGWGRMTDMHMVEGSILHVRSGIFFFYLGGYGEKIRAYV